MKKAHNKSCVNNTHGVTFDVYQGKGSCHSHTQPRRNIMTTYTTRNEAVQREIIEPLGEWAEEHNIDAIADTLIKAEDEGFTIDQDADYWAVVAANTL